MTHIRNKDVRLMVVATCFAGGLTLLGEGLARTLFPPQPNYNDLHYSYQQDHMHDPKGGRGAVAAKGLLEFEASAPVAVVISLVIAVVFFAMAHVLALLTKFALSRAREFLADAGAVELTKNPDALISALQKISGNDEIPGLNANMHAMMISARFDGFFATHPAMETRVMALQQHAGGRVVERRPRMQHSSVVSVREYTTPAGSLGIAGGRASFGKRGAINA
jgi:heat shock protein HtpX